MNKRKIAKTIMIMAATAGVALTPMTAAAQPMQRASAPVAAGNVDKALSRYKARMDIESGNYPQKVSLIYLDNNSIPEMVLCDGAEGKERMPKIYTYRNGKVKSVNIVAEYSYGNNMYASDVTYVKKKGYVSVKCRPLYDEHIYFQLKNGKFRHIATINADDEWGTHGGDTYRKGNGWPKPIKHSEYSSYEARLNKKYTKGAQHLTMYNTFEEAKNALGSSNSRNSSDAGKKSTGKVTKLADGRYSMVFKMDYGAEFTQAKISGNRITVKGKLDQYKGKSSTAKRMPKKSRTLALSNSCKIQYKSEGYTQKCSVSEFNRMFKKGSEDFIGQPVLMIVKNGKVTEIDLTA